MMNFLFLVIAESLFVKVGIIIFFLIIIVLIYELYYYCFRAVKLEKTFNFFESATVIMVGMSVV